MYPKSKFVEREKTKCNFLLWARNIFLFFIFHNTYHGNQLQTAECRGAFTLWAHYKTFSKLYIYVYIFVPIICSLALICSVYVCNTKNIGRVMKNYDICLSIFIHTVFTLYVCTLRHWVIFKVQNWTPKIKLIDRCRMCPL